MLLENLVTDTKMHNIFHSNFVKIVSDRNGLLSPLDNVDIYSMGNRATLKLMGYAQGARGLVIFFVRSLKTFEGSQSLQCQTIFLLPRQNMFSLCI